MLGNVEVVNKLKTISKVSLKHLIKEKFTPESGKFFFSIEVTPKAGFKIDFNEFKVLPLFVDITWIKDDNLKVPIKNSPAFDLARKIKSSQVVNTVTCYNLSDDLLDEILNGFESISNFTVLRGEIVDENQKFKFANELVADIRQKTKTSEKVLTIFAGGYPETHVESKSSIDDLRHLKRKVESGVDIILTQVVFSVAKFVEFVRKCREIEISSEVFIIPGLYIPFNFKELNLVLRITKVAMDPATYKKFEELKDDDEQFKKLSLAFMTNLIRGIQETSSEFIRGFHFFTMNHFEMIQSLVEFIDFSEE